MTVAYGVWAWWGSNFGFLHWLASSPLQHSRTTVRVRDLKVTGLLLMSLTYCVCSWRAICLWQLSSYHVFVQTSRQTVSCNTHVQLLSYANDRRTRNRRQNPVPKKPVPVYGACDMQFRPDYFRYRFSVTNRNMLFSCRFMEPVFGADIW